MTVALGGLFFRGRSGVSDRVQVVFRRRRRLFQLVQLERLAVLAANVHQERVVRDAVDSGGLRGRHLPIPDILQSLGQLIVGPGSGWAAPGGTVLTFRTATC